MRNVVFNYKTKNDDDYDEEIADDNNTIAASTNAAAAADIKRFSYNIETTVTTVPQQHQSITTSINSQSTSSSLLKSSPTALAKFNRIIDATMPDTNVYQQQLTHWTSNDSTIRTTSEAMKKNGKIVVAKEDDNQIKRNDVHYLLKQLNSFSDIEEIEIVDMQQKQKDKQKQLDEQEQQTDGMEGTESTTINITNITKSKNQIGELYSPTAQSLVLKSPSSFSHRGIRRYASLHQTHQTHETLPTMVVASLSQQLPPTQAAQYYTTSTSTTTASAAATTADGVGATSVATAAHLLQQFDDYLFQSCHYLETNYFAANYRTAMVESSSHEFRPSTTTGTSASYSSHSSVHTFDLHETEPPSVICKALPPQLVSPIQQQHQQQQQQQKQLRTPLPPMLSPRTEVPMSPCQLSVAMFTMSHERMQDHYQQQYPHYTYAIHAQQPPALAPPTRRFQMQTRLTSSGVQTELTASSLSTAATNSLSLAKSFSSVASAASHPTSTSSSSSTEAARCRRKPFFKCCYTPIDRWRERRTAAATHKQQRAGSQPGLDATKTTIKTAVNTTTSSSAV